MRTKRRHVSVSERKDEEGTKKRTQDDGCRQRSDLVPHSIIVVHKGYISKE
jgi:hypothetical protein